MSVIRAIFGHFEMSVVRAIFGHFKMSVIRAIFGHFKMSVCHWLPVGGPGVKWLDCNVPTRSTSGRSADFLPIQYFPIALNRCISDALFWLRFSNCMGQCQTAFKRL